MSVRRPESGQPPSPQSQPQQSQPQPSQRPRSKRPRSKRVRRPRIVAGILIAAIVAAGAVYAVFRAGSTPGLSQGATVLSGGEPGGSSNGSQGTVATTDYYLAMGDSLAMGVGASEDEHNYVSLIFRHEAERYGDLRLQNLGCGGATTKSVIYGPGCGDGTQLGSAEEFLRAHAGHVAFVTIDIGGNDLIACVDGPEVNQRCVEGAFAAVSAYLPRILAGLRSAYPGVRVYGMDYYDPYLADWLSGLAGENMAEETVSVVGQLNSALEKAYATAGVPMADPASAFQSRDFSPTGSYMGGKVPQNVANVCHWTKMCPDRNVHTNDAGHAVLAGTFESLIDREFATPVRVAAGELPSAVAGQLYSAGVPVAGGVTPYEWKLVGALPPGLDLAAATGVISGRLGPGARGTYAFEVQVADRTQPAHTATQRLSIAVR